jgi:hypothetical protein
MTIVKNNLIPLVLSAVLFSLITACGGGSEPDKTSSIIKSQPPQPYQITQQPHKPLDKQLRRAYKLSRNTDSVLAVTSNENSIIITYTADNITSRDNFQFFLHADNDTSVGFQQKLLWDKPGAEYLIENGTLYKSGSNDSSWNWNAVSSNLPYNVTATSFSVTIDKSLLDNLASEIFIGFIQRNANWQLDRFYPESGKIAAFNIATPPPSVAGIRGPMVGINSSSKYLIYYGIDYSQENIDRMKNFDIVVLHPNRDGMTPAVVKELQDAGVSRVLGYISIGEDLPYSDELPIVHQGKGPIYRDENTQQIVHQNQGVASFYVDSVYDNNSKQYVHDGIADTNGSFGGYFIHPDSDWNWVLNEMRIGGNPHVFTQRKHIAGLKQIVGQRDINNLNDRTTNFGFDGFFLDTIDTAGPYTAKGWYPWVAEAMQKTVKFISDSYPDKTILANRGSFYFHAGLHNTTYDIKPIDYSIRPYINAMLFESYMLDSNGAHTGISPFFADNDINVAPKLITEANRPDGFTITHMDYKMNRPASLYDQLFTTVVKENGWVSYLSLNGYIENVDLEFSQKLDNQDLMQDTAPPQWMHTGRFAHDNKTPRIGVQRLKKGNATGEVIVLWDSAKDQSLPVKYNIAIATKPDFSDQIIHKHVAFKKNPAWDIDPTNNVANQFTLTGLEEKIYYVRVTAEDSSANNLEDNNTHTLSINLTPAISNPLTQAPIIDANLDEWQALQSFGSDAKDMPTATALDWQQTWMAHDDNTLYLAYKYHNPLQMSWGHITYLDTDTNRNTGFTGGGDTMPIGVEYMLQEYRLWKYTGNGTSWSWEFIAETGRNWNLYHTEMYLPRAWIGNPGRVDLYYEANNYAIGETSVDLFPNTVISEGDFFSYSFE